jgi:NAD+ synthase
MDLLWYGYENNYDPSEVGAALGKNEEEIKSIFRNFKRKQKTTEYLRMKPIVTSDLSLIQSVDF